MMKNVPSNVKDKYEILGIIGEGIEFYLFFCILLIILIKGAYGVVLKARKKVDIRNAFINSIIYLSLGYEYNGCY